MTKFFHNKAIRITIAAIFSLYAATIILGQAGDSPGKNNPYSPSPSSQLKEDRSSQVAVQLKEPLTPPVKVGREIDIRPTVAQTSLKTVKTEETSSISPVEIYKVGVGDMLFVNLRNAANASGYYTVRTNGSIDFPLAGENVVVTNKTVSEIQYLLANAITLYRDARIEVKIREYGSHKINVTGMAERIGERSIQREAIPLYVVRAESLVSSNATKALIRRSDLSNVETYDLHDPKTDDVLIYPGNSVEFTADGTHSVLMTSGFYYIAGEINKAGQKEFASGMTLVQAITASGGAKGNPKKAIIRRKGDKGALTVTDYDLRAIRSGKLADPILSPGDMIEITN